MRHNIPADRRGKGVSKLTFGIVVAVLLLVLFIEIRSAVIAIASNPPFSNNNGQPKSGDARGQVELAERSDRSSSDPQAPQQEAEERDGRRRRELGFKSKVSHLLNTFTHSTLGGEDFSPSQRHPPAPTHFVQWLTTDVDQSDVDHLLDSFESTEIDAVIVISGGNRLPKWVRTRTEGAKMLQEGVVARLRARQKHLRRLVDLDQGDDVIQDRRKAARAKKIGECYEQEKLDVDERLASGGPPLIVSGGGTPHVAPTLRTDNGVERVLQESTEMVEYLRAIGYTGPIQKEIASYDTLGQAFYLRLLFASVERWRRVFVVTSSWHLERTRFMFETVFNLEPKLDTEVIFVGATPGTDDTSLVERRTQHEAESLISTRQRFDPTRPGNSHLTSFAKFHKWIFVNHTCYDDLGPRETGHADPSFLY